MTAPDISALEHFVRGTLGCKCPDEVFESIAVDHVPASAGALAHTRLVVGNRLLIYVLTVEPGRRTNSVVSNLTGAGVVERNTRGLNRLRIVVASSQPTQLLEDAKAGFDDAAGRDDHTHLHVIAIDQVPAGLR